MREPLQSLRSDSSFSLPLQLSSWADLDAVAQPHQAGGGSLKDDDDANTFTVLPLEVLNREQVCVVWL
jgi:hypothetical protein